jgi:hypothetical protein
MRNETKEAFDARFDQEMTDAAKGMRRVGVMTEADYKLTMRDLKRPSLPRTHAGTPAARIGCGSAAD